MKVNAIIEKGKDGTYDVCMEVRKELTFGLLGQGNTVKEAIDDFYVSFEDMKQLYRDIEREFPEDLEFKFYYDTASFLQYYTHYFSLAGLSRLTGIHQGQLSHYVNGTRNPSKQTIQKIDTSIHNFANHLSQVQFT